jgi:hypothetical protein
MDSFCLKKTAFLTFIIFQSSKFRSYSIFKSILFGSDSVTDVVELEENKITFLNWNLNFKMLYHCFDVSSLCLFKLFL